MELRATSASNKDVSYKVVINRGERVHDMHRRSLLSGLFIESVHKYNISIEIHEIGKLVGLNHMSRKVARVRLEIEGKSSTIRDKVVSLDERGHFILQRTIESRVTDAVKRSDRVR